MEDKSPHIIVKDLTMAYGDFVVMHDLDFTINRRDIFIIMGGSGCGKSTLMTMLIGLKPPAKGQVLYGDLDFWGSDPETRDRIIRNAGVMYQSGALWSSMTLAENLGFLLRSEQIYVRPWPQAVPVKYQLALELIRFDGKLGGEARLIARWSVSGEETGKPLAVKRSSIQELTGGSGYEDLVAAESRAVAKLSREIAEIIITQEKDPAG